MSQYGVAKDGWWEGETGRRVAALGGKDAQLLAFYLFKNPDDNMIGLYRARLVVIRERIGTISSKGIETAFGVLADVGFAEYDRATEHVWVREGAKFRLGIDRKPLQADDKRAIGARHLYEKAKDNPFLEPFFRRYRTDLHLSKARRFKGTADILRRGFEGAFKPVSGSQYQENSTQEDQERSADQDPRRGRRTLGEAQNLRSIERHIRAALNAELDTRPDSPDSELSAIGKDVAAKCEALDYTSRAIGVLIDAVRGERDRRRA